MSSFSVAPTWLWVGFCLVNIAVLTTAALSSWYVTRLEKKILEKKMGNQ